MQPNGLNNRVLKTLSQSAPKAAVDLLGMRISTSINDQFVEIMITETEAFGRKSIDKLSLLNNIKNIPTSLTLGPPYISVLKTYGNNKSLFLLAGKKGSGEAVLIKSGVVLIGKRHVENRRKAKLKYDRISGPGNITKSLGIELVNDGENILTGSINLSPRIHPVDQAVAMKRKNSKRGDKHLWRYTLITK